VQNNAIFGVLDMQDLNSATVSVHIAACPSFKDSKGDLGLYRVNWIIFVAYLPEGMYIGRQ
jgi:hypothetical protein